MLSLVRTQLEQLPESERADAAIGTLKRLFLNDFYLFSRFFLCYKDITKAAHSEMISVFESRATRKIIVEPRGSFKSTLGSVSYPLWRLLRNPNLAILLDSELYTNSKNFLREIKSNVDSERMRIFFGDQIGKKWDESEITIKARTQNRKEASITCGGVGTVKTGQHYDLIIYDDLNSYENSETPEKCEKIINHVRYGFSLLNPGGEMVWIATRYAERDAVGYLLKEILDEPLLAEGKLQLKPQGEKPLEKSSLLGE